MVSLAAVVVAEDFGGVWRLVLRTGTSFEVGFLFISGHSIEPSFVQCNKNFETTALATRGVFVCILTN